MREAGKDCLSPGFEIFDMSFAYSHAGVKIQVSLDKKSDPYGSPNVEDCERFMKLLRLKFDAYDAAGEMPANYSIEVSSPGAEREIRFPDELERFKALPLKVLHTGENDKSRQDILNYQGIDGDISTWKLADVKFNRKSGIITKKNKDEIRQIENARIRRVSLYLDW